MAPSAVQQCLQRNVDDLKSCAFWKAVLAELLGTGLLVFMGCAVCMKNWQETEESKQGASIVQIALTFGIAVATVVWCIAHVSGGHINPAVTVPMLLTRKITIVKAIFYVLAQSIGAILGSGLLHFLHPHDYAGKDEGLGNTTLGKDMQVIQGLGIELVITFVLVFTVFSSCDKRRNDLGGSVPLSIGLSVALCHMFAIKYTGSSMNPARSFGPAVVASVWADHWIYWVGPISGGVLAGFLYELIFAVDASVSKFKGMLSPGGNDSYELAATEERTAASKV